MMPGMYPKIVSRRHIQNSICKTNKQASKDVSNWAFSVQCRVASKCILWWVQRFVFHQKHVFPHTFTFLHPAENGAETDKTLPWKFPSLLSRLSSYYYNWDTSTKKDWVLTMQPYFKNTPRGGKRMAIRISQHVARTPPFPILQSSEK
jgi:hypothetical protein